MKKDIETALDQIRRRAPGYAKCERYYNGDHDLRFATEKFVSTFGDLFREFALNLCPVVCDAVRDRLRVTDLVNGTDEQIGAESVNADAARIWSRNRMNTRSGEIHKEALKCGDAYLIVWPDRDGQAVIYPNRAANMTVIYDDESPGRIRFAAKVWTDGDSRMRINLFYADRIEKYVTRTKTLGTAPESNGFVPNNDGNDAIVPNPYGIVPVFHFINNSDIGSPGRSELEAAMPIQDGLNKAALDMLVAMEFAAFRQRWASGIEVDYDEAGKPIAPFSSGIDKLWISGDTNSRFGDFAAADLEQFLSVKDSFRSDIASVTGTPLHYFLQEAQTFPSGASLRQAESRFIAKITDRQETFGQTWAEAIAFSLQIEGDGPECTLRTRWQDPSPLTEREILENMILRKQITATAETV